MSAVFTALIKYHNLFNPSVVREFEFKNNQRRPDLIWASSSTSPRGWHEINSSCMNTPLYQQAMCVFAKSENIRGLNDGARFSAGRDLP